MIHKTVSSITQNANGFMNIVFYTIEFVFLTALFLLCCLHMDFTVHCIG